MENKKQELDKAFKAKERTTEEGFKVYRLDKPYGVDDFYIPDFTLSKQMADKIYKENNQVAEGIYDKYESITEVTDFLEFRNLMYHAYDDFKNNPILYIQKYADNALVEHICDKFYPNEDDKQFFKENKIAYDDDGRIEKIQLINDDRSWVALREFENIEALDEYFAESEYIKKQQKQKITEQSVDENEVKSDDFSFIIKVSPIEEGFDEKTKKLCDEHNLFGKIWQGDEAKNFTRFMSEVVDKQVWENAISENKLPSSKVKLEINFDSGENINIDVPLGRRLFENGDIQKLIAVSQKELKVNQISDETAQKWNELFRKNEKGEYVNKVNNHTIENMFNGGIAGLAKSAQSIGDEHLTAFVQGFANAYGFSKVAPTQEKAFDPNAEKQPNLADVNKKIDNLAQSVSKQSSEKENSQENQKQSKKSSEITQAEMEAVKAEVNQVGNEVLNKGKKPNDKQISKPTDKSMS